MEIMLIDFDEKFSSYIKDWLTDNKDKYKSLDEVELLMPQIYEKWLITPQDFLSGKKPSEYFMDFEAEDLVNLMVRYEAKNVGVPDPLLDAISQKKAKALPFLADIALLNTELPKNTDSAAVRITAVNLINEIDPSAYIAEYIGCITEEGLDEGLAEAMSEAVKENAKGHKGLLVIALENTDDSNIKNMLLDILCNMPFEQKVFDELISMLKSSKEKALYASYLGKYGSAKAVKTLTSALDWLNINYLDYIEIRNALEELGEEVTHQRSFEGDKYYESMKGLYDE